MRGGPSGDRLGDPARPPPGLDPPGRSTIPSTWRHAAIPPPRRWVTTSNRDRSPSGRPRSPCAAAARGRGSPWAGRRSVSNRPRPTSVRSPPPRRLL